MAQGDGTLRLELIFLHSANGGGCFRWRDEDSTYLQSEPDARPEYVGLKGNVVEVVILQAAERSPLQIQQSSIGKCLKGSVSRWAYLWVVLACVWPSSLPMTGTQLRRSRGYVADHECGHLAIQREQKIDEAEALLKSLRKTLYPNRACGPRGRALCLDRR